MTPLERLLWLDKQIKYHSKLYYEEDRSELSDAEYDALLFEYNNLVNQFPDLIGELKKNIEGPLIGTTVTPATFDDRRLPAVALDPPMLSLDNALSLEAHNTWKSKLPEEVELINEYKLDGLAIRLIYVNGALETISTRGTGTEGEDITVSAKLISNIPLELPSIVEDGLEILIDGELCISKENLIKINDLVTKPYKTPRHAAAGLARTLEPNDLFIGSLEFFSYGMPGVKQYNYDRVIKELRLLGFSTTSDFVVDNDWTKRPELPYAVDGIVTKVNGIEDQKEIGVTAHHPKWAIAYKFSKLTASTKLRGVEWQVGGTGTVTPVVIFDPVEVGGVTVTRASLHNFRAFDRQAEGLKVGADITVGLSADIVPELVSIDSFGKGKQLKSPKLCPCCETPLTFEGSNGEQIFLRCENQTECPAQITGRLIRFVSREGMNIVGVGSVTIDKLVKDGLVRSFINIMELGTRFPLNPKLGEAIEKSKTVPLPQFLYAIGIPGVGEHLSKVLAQHLSYDNEDVLFNQLTDKDWLMTLPGIEWDTALKIVNYIKCNLSELKPLSKLMSFTTEPNILVEKVVVLTGNFGGNRKEIAEELKQHGIAVQSNVTRSVNAVFLGSNYTSHKEKKAIDLDIPVYRISVDFNQVVNTIVSLTL